MTDVFTFKTSDELGAQIRELAASHHEGNISKTLISMAEVSLNIENRFSFLDDQPCPIRDYLDDREAPPKKGAGWYCLKRAPALTLLGSGIAEAAGKICKGCQIRDGALNDSKLLKERVKQGIILDIPSCSQGGKVSEDLKQLYCKHPRMSQEWRDVHKWCKLIRNGANCESLRWTKVPVKEKISLTQNR